MSCMRLFSRASKQRLVIAGIILTLIVFYANHEDLSLRQPQALSKEGIDLESFEAFSFSGYTNTRVPDGPNCDDIRIDDEQQLAVSKSDYLEDDLYEIVSTTQHPMIDYSGDLKDLTLEEKVQRTWGRMAGSGVWLPKYNVYFLVSRVYFYSGELRNYGRISFVRAQLFNAKWEHLNGHTIDWRGESITFPRILDIPSPYMIGGYWYGPEDPRVVVEPGIPDAEPIIVFNMITNATSYVRAMHIHRPFSKHTSELVIEDFEAHHDEKNWSPFFMPTSGSSSSSAKQLSYKYIHFVYDFSLLRILRCHLITGRCQFIYSQEQVGSYYKPYIEEHEYHIPQDDIRGGTNLIHASFDTRSGLTSFVGFPRTHITTGCGKEALYRPVLALLATNGTHYFLDYMSTVLEFGHAILNKQQYDDPCEEGRILIASSIAKFEERSDLMTITFTAADATVQVANVYGVRSLIEKLPQMQTWSTTWQQLNMIWRLNVTHDVLECATKSGVDFAITYASPKLAESPKQEQ